MPYANIYATLTDADMLDIFNHIDQSKVKLPFLVNLTIKERKKAGRKGASVKAFNKKTLIYAQQNPQYIPSYLDINGTYADQELCDKLKAEPVNSVYLAGNHSLTLSADNLQNGIYTYRVTIDNHHSVSKRMVVLK